MMKEPKSISFKHERAFARLTPLDEKLYMLSNMYSQTRGQGHATGVLQQIVDFADDNNIELRLLVQRYGPHHSGLDNLELEMFYAKFGFVRDPSPGRPIRMDRKPQNGS